nr:hypothetical protein [Tanacetum cinerariifolium]
MSTQQDIYASGSKSRPSMLNKENYVPWSSRLLRYAKSRPNGKLINNSILNGLYVRRMIPEPGDANREVTVTETFHVQTNDELSEKELKQIEADDQAIQTILFGLPEDIYAAVDSCKTAQEIWLRVQQFMKGSEIGIQEKKTKLFNEWERFTSNEGESIESYYHHFLKLMNDLKRNKHFPEKIATDYTQLHDFLKYNKNEVDELKAERLAKTQDPLALMANSNNPYAFPAPHQDQPSFNQNYMQQPMPNPKDIIDPTTVMNMALALMAKALKLNYSTPTNNNQRISSNPRNRQIAQPGMNMGQDRHMQMVRGNDGNQFRQYAGQNARNMTGYNDVIENQVIQNAVQNPRAKEKGCCLSSDTVIDCSEGRGRNLTSSRRQASTSSTQTDSAPVYDSDGSAENDNDVISEDTSVEQGGETIEQHPVNFKETRALYDSLYQNLATKVEKVNSVNRNLKETNADLTTELARFKNQIRMTIETHNWSSFAHQELHKIVREENFPIVNQVDDRVQNFEIKFLKEAAKFIGDFKSLANEADASLAKYKALELEIERLLKAVVSQDIMNIVQKESVVDTSDLQTELKHTKECFEKYNTKTRRPQPKSNTKNDRVPSASKSSRSKNKEAEVEEHHRNLLLSKNNKHMSSTCNNIKLDSQYVISKFVYAMCKQCLISVNHDVCLRNYVNGKNSRAKKQKAKVSVKEIQKKYQPKVTKPKKVGFPEILATPKPRKPRFLLRWSPTGRLFDQEGKLLASSEFESQSDCSNGENACTSNTLEPKIKRFPNSTSLLDRQPDISFLYVFGALCYPKNDHEDIRKLGAKGDIRFFIGYSADSCAYKIFNQRTKKIIKTMNVSFDELSAMAFEQHSSKLGLQSMTSGHISSGLDLTYAPSTITTQQPTEGELDLLFEAMYDDYMGGQPSDTAPTPTNSSSHAKKIPITSQDVDELNSNAMVDGNTFVNQFANSSISAAESSSSQNVDPSNIHMFYQPYPHKFQWTKDHPLEQVIREPPRPVLTRNQLRSDGDMCMYALTVSTMEPKNVKEAMIDPAWIDSMQEELL